jgi:putative transposase
MLTMNFSYRIYPNATQQQLMLDWLETCRQVYNYSLRELKDWLASRKCLVDRCSLNKEYIIPTDQPFPSYQWQQDQLPKAKKDRPELAALHSQVLQTTVRRLHDTWEAFQKRGFGFPRFKKYGQFRSFVFPQFKSNPITGYQIKLPKIGAVVINLHRPIPDGFTVKQVRVVSRCRNTQWYVVITISSDVSVPNVPVHGRAIGIDLGLEKFLTTSESTTVEHPRGTSQTCPECGATVAKPLSEREHICPECGYRTHRDHAAAQVVLNRGIENLVPQDLGEWKLPSNGVLSGVSYLDKCRSRNAIM